MERIGKIVVLPSSMTIKGPNKSGIRSHLTLNELTSSVYEGEDNIDFASLSLPHSQESRMFDHQRDGVKWMYGLYLKNSGGILGDDMGLGKTFQVTCLLTGLMTKQLIRRVLIITPVSVLPSWMRELNDQLKPHVSKASIDLVNSDLTKKKRQQILESVGARASPYKPHIIVSSYALVSSMIEDFSQFEWDYVILDEGHLIKNPTTKTTKAMHQLESKHRLMLTGTPVQNNLKEFWTIADWVTNGCKFGSLPAFTERFIVPIMNGQDPKACDYQRQVSTEAIQRLMTLTKPILLQRKKCEQPPEMLNLPEKVEMVIWIPLATSQRTIYDEFLRSRAFSQALEGCTYPVAVINHLKTLSRHPFLLEATRVNKRRKAQLEGGGGAGGASKKAGKTTTTAGEEDECDVDDLVGGMTGLTLTGSNSSSNNEEDVDGDETQMLSKLPADASVFDIADRHPNIHELFQGSVKLRVLSKLVFRLHRAGHRCLVFSQSRLMLDIIQRVLVEYRLSSYRIDGTTSQKDRQQIIDDFNDLSESYTGPTICLLTTKACGTGITLTGADRVIIFDPSWNPAEDRQAVDRAFRIGQTRNVVVYRMIMASSVEEKMYEKQVFKDGLRVVTESGSSSRYFSSDETRALFTLGPFDRSVVMEKFWKSSGGSITSYEDTGGELPGALGYTRHDNLYREIRPQDVQDQTKDLKSRASTAATVNKGNAGGGGATTNNKTKLETWLDQENVNKNIIVIDDDKKIGKKTPVVEVVDLTQEDKTEKPTWPVKPTRRIVIDDSEDEESAVPVQPDPTAAAVVRRVIPDMESDDEGVDVTKDVVDLDDMDWLRDVPSDNEEGEEVEEQEVVLTNEESEDSLVVVEDEVEEELPEEGDLSPAVESESLDATPTVSSQTTTDKETDFALDQRVSHTEEAAVEESGGGEEAVDLCSDFAQMTMQPDSPADKRCSVDLCSAITSQETSPQRAESVGNSGELSQCEDHSVDQSCEESFLCLELCELKDITAAAAAIAAGPFSAAPTSRSSGGSNNSAVDLISPIKEGYCEDLSQPDVPSAVIEITGSAARRALIDLASGAAPRGVDVPSPSATTEKFLPDLFYSPPAAPGLTIRPTTGGLHGGAAGGGATVERAMRVDSQYQALQCKLDLLSSAIMSNECPGGTPLSYGDSMFTVQSDALLVHQQQSTLKAPYSATTAVSNHSAGEASGDGYHYLCNAETPQMLFHPLCSSQIEEISPLGITPHNVLGRNDCNTEEGEQCGGENLGADLESAV